MRYLVAAAALACAGAGAAPKSPPPIPPGLRQAVQQYHPEPTAVPRQLSPAERAELRRQVTESSEDRRRR